MTDQTVSQLLERGLVHYRAGRHDPAIELFSQALKIQTDHPEAKRGLADALVMAGWSHQQAGRRTEAELLYAGALRLVPGHAEALQRIGQRTGQTDRDEVIEIDRLNQLGNAALIQGRPEEAIAYFKHALGLRSGQPEVLNNLGNAYQTSGQLGLAIPCYEQALEIRPAFPEALNNLGNALSGVKRTDEARRCFLDALRFRPDYIDALNNLGNLHQALAQSDQARGYYSQVLRQQPQNVDALNNLANTLRGLGDMDDALICFVHAIALKPDHPEIHMNFGLLLLAYGWVGSSRGILQRTLTFKPTNTKYVRNMISVGMYDPTATPQTLFSQATSLARRLAPVGGVSALQHASADKRRLTIGYVSSDFRQHPVGRNMLPILEYRDRDHFEIVLYANVATEDFFTERFRTQCDRWVSIIGMTDREVAERIRADGIDILVLLAGRFDDNRPFLASYRAAPIQVSIHDVATSGIPEMDYLIADPILAPRGGEERFTERVARLPHFVIHRPISNAPDIVPRGHGPIQFASFNNPSKINDSVLALWRRVLDAVPQSRLKLKYLHTYKSQLLQQRVLDGLKVDPSRVDFAAGGQFTPVEHLAAYGDVDLSLDTFPFSGSTTTYESLWMGVPVVTMPGRMMVSRWTASICKTVGLDEFVANSPDDFVHRAVSAAGDSAMRSTLRRDLRQRIALSPLCQAARKARQFERLYQWMWRRYRAG